MSAEPIGAVKPNGHPFRYHPGDIIGGWELVRYDGHSKWVMRCLHCELADLLMPYEARMWGCSYCKRKETAIQISTVRQAVCAHFKLTDADMKCSSRIRRIAQPRMLAMALARELTNRSFPKIGAHFGGRDHTTVIHAVERIALMREDPTWEAHYQAVKEAVMSKKPLHVQEQLEPVNV